MDPIAIIRQNCFEVIKSAAVARKIRVPLPSSQILKGLPADTIVAVENFARVYTQLEDEFWNKRNLGICFDSSSVSYREATTETGSVKSSYKLFVDICYVESREIRAQIVKSNEAEFQSILRDVQNQLLTMTSKQTYPIRVSMLVTSRELPYLMREVASKLDGGVILMEEGLYKLHKN